MGTCSFVFVVFAVVVVALYSSFRPTHLAKMVQQSAAHDKEYIHVDGSLHFKK